jgi:CO/xanthine dehydrogenase FAD-binding subunit
MLTQVRGVATWAGNIAMAAQAALFPSDVLTLVSAADTSLTLLSRSTGALSTMEIAAFIARSDVC